MIRSTIILVTTAGFLTWGGGKSAKEDRAKAESAPAEVVTLLEAGKEPRKALRYMPAKGGKCRAEIDGSAQVELKIEGPNAWQTIPVPALPPIEMRFETLVTDVESDGTAHIDMEVTGFDFADTKEAPDLLTPKVRASLVSRIGTTERWTASNRGTIRGIQMASLPGVDAKSRTGIETLLQGAPIFLATLPSEAVGAGARWKVETSANLFGLAVKLETTYTLRSVDGNAIRVDASIRAGADPVREAAGSRPRGGNDRLGSLAIQGDAEMELDLARAMPVETRAKLDAISTRPLPNLDATSTVTARIEVAVKSK